MAPLLDAVAGILGVFGLIVCVWDPPHTCLVNSSDGANSAVVVPLMTAGGCVGAFAVELPRAARRGNRCALATIFAAQLATLFAYAPLAEAVSA
jgi:hypothetical protein